MQVSFVQSSAAVLTDFLAAWGQAMYRWMSFCSGSFGDSIRCQAQFFGMPVDVDATGCRQRYFCPLFLRCQRGRCAFPLWNLMPNWSKPTQLDAIRINYNQILHDKISREMPQSPHLGINILVGSPGSRDFHVQTASLEDGATGGLLVGGTPVNIDRRPMLSQMDGLETCGNLMKYSVASCNAKTQTVLLKSS